MRTIASFLLLGATACVKSPLTSPLDGGAAWRELSSEHFVLQTNSDAGRARELVTELEQSFALLQQVAFDYRPRLSLKVRVVNLDGAADLSELGWKNYRGYARSGEDGFTSRQVLVLADGQRQLDSELVQHELTHRFVAYYTPQVPLWLNEGLAEPALRRS